MTPFSSAWLRLREPLDAASRSRRIAETLKRVTLDRPRRIIDLASGTGANLRCLSRILGGHQEWTLIDHDQALLDTIPRCMTEWAASRGANVRPSDGELLVSGRGFECRVRVARRDLATALSDLDLPAEGLITASALLDLVSDTWLQTLARRCSSVRATILFALTYDGRVSFDPPEPEDERVHELVDRHQRTDKGFGPALGPAAAEKVVRHFETIGYRVECERSDWQIKPTDANLQEALLEGWLAAAIETAPEEASILRDWLQRRRAHVEGGRSELNVGHVDMLGWLPQ